MENKEQKRFSRRSFLKGIPVGIASVAVISALGGRLTAGRKASQYPKFPEGSIFTPDKRHTDA